MGRTIRLGDNQRREPPLSQESGRLERTRVQIDQRHVLRHLLGVHAASVRCASSSTG